MSRHAQRASGLALVIGLLLSMLSGFALAENIRLTNGNWAPYLSATPPHGTVSQLIAGAFAREGVDVTWGFFPWSRSYALARDGHWDGSAAWSCTRERYRDFYFSEAIAPIRYVFFHRTDQTFEWDGIDDLKDLRIGLTQDYSYGPLLKIAEQKGWITTDITASDEVNFRKLLAGRIDLFPMDIRAGQALIKKHFTTQQALRLTYHPRVLHSANLHLVLSRRVAGNQAMLKRFNSGLRALRTEHTISSSRAADTDAPPAPIGQYPQPSDECRFDLQNVSRP